MATEDLEWERSKISNQDVNLMKKLGLMKKEGAIRFPSEESYPSPPIEYRVSFVDHLIRGLSAPIHDFLRGLLFVYGVQLHQLTPNSILHVAIFITLCESFLGVPPNWALWKRIFCLRRNGSHNATYNIGGVIICVRSDVEYFDVKFPDPVQGWRKRWLYVHEESANSVEHNIAPFDGNAKVLRRRSWDAEATEEEKTATEALMSRIYELQNTRGKELSGSHKSAASSEKEVDSEATASAHSPPPAVSPKNKRKMNEVEDSGTSKAEEAGPSEGKKAFDPFLDALVSSDDEEENPPIDVTARTSTSRTLVVSDAQLSGGFTTSSLNDQSEKARKEAEADAKKAKAEAATVEDLRKRLHEAENSLSERISEQSAREEAIIKRLASQSRRFVRKTGQEYELSDPENDPLLDALSLLEIHGDEARDSLAEAEAGLSRLYPYFFPKKEQPTPFLALAKCFNTAENLGLKLRQESLKVGVEGTIALVADSQQNIDWTKVGDTQEMETKKWQSLIKAAKPNSKKVLAYLGCKPTPAPRSSKALVQ
ncbi:hypothetical protein QYE76_008476 [Lolium multiflorum]|uniref:Transposase (putative) gypsy type domain-containing protein n=1 Tax=Lolium multiflorum TaxID=4521 RepID=A0AAD8TTC6_LOLMU|nr:hypothetical protein QYE76_008476 [Lolium multiflorum]